MDVYKKKWELLYDHVMEADYGSIISHQEISHIIGESHNSNKYGTIINRAKKSLLAQGRLIESVRGVGYRVIEPDDYSGKSISVFRQGFNKLKKASDLLAYAPVASMSEEGRLIHQNVTDRVKILHAAVAGGCTEINLLARKQSAFLPENVSRK